MQDVIQLIRDRKDEHVARLQDWLRIPSVSTDSAHQKDTRQPRSSSWPSSGMPASRAS